MSGHYELGKSLREDFRNHGAVKAPSLIEEELLKRCCECFEWGKANPGPAASKIFPNTIHECLNDNANPKARHRYIELVQGSVFREFLKGLWDSEKVFFYSEELFSKRGGECGRTPWHQDTFILPWGGPDWANIWIPFHKVPRSNALEVVKGSYKGKLYDGCTFTNPEDPTEPYYDNGVLERLPDIEADRAKNPDSWDVIGWGLDLGDALIVHPHSLHGGAKLSEEHPKRDTLVLRFFGDRASFKPLPHSKGGFLASSSGETDEFGPAFKGHLTHLKEGDAFRAPIFPEI